MPRSTGTRSSPPSSRRTGTASRRASRSRRTTTPIGSSCMNVGTERLYDVDAGRSDQQRAYMEELEAKGICIFCPEHVAEYQGQPVEFSGEHWYVTRNDFPYEGTVAHYLIVAH